MENNLIVIKQLPVIEDQLQAVKKSIEERVQTALSLVCTEDTYKSIKKVRSELNKEYQELEKRRKEVKAQILKPYESFEGIYKECAGDLYSNADAQLKKKINEVEDGLKKQKEEELEAYFKEYRAILGLAEDFVSLGAAGIRVGLSDSMNTLKKSATEFLDRIASDLQVIEGLESRDEVLTEYRNSYNLSGSMLIVENRHKLIEAEKARREALEAERLAAEEAAKKAQAEPAPEPAPAPVEQPKAVSKMYTVLLRITTTKDGMNQLKDFMERTNIAFERVKGENT